MHRINIPSLLIGAFAFSALALGASFAEARPLPAEFRALNQFGEDVEPSDLPDWHPQRGGSLRLSIAWPYDLFYPENFRDEKQIKAAPYTGNFIYESLMWSRSIGFSETIFSGIVRSITNLAEEKAFVLHVQEGVTFSDGTAVTAADVVRSYDYQQRHMWTTGSATGLAHLRLFGEGVTVTQTGPMDVTVKFRLENESDRRRALYTFLGDVVLFKENPTSNPKVTVPNELIGTGPYVVSRADRGGFTLARRENYWNPTSPLGNYDEIKVSVQLDQTMGRMAFSRGDTNYWVEDTANKGAYLDQQLKSHGTKRYNLPIEPVAPVRVLYMNRLNAHFRSLRFRKAMMMALDDETMEQGFRAYDNNQLSRIRALGDGGHYPVKGTPSAEAAELIKGDENEAEALKPFGEMGMMSGRELKTRRERLRAALDLLREDGYRLDHNVLRNSKGKPVVLRILAWHNAIHTRYLFAFMENLKRLGIDITLRDVSDDSLLVAALRAGDYDFFNGRLRVTRDMSYLDPTSINDSFLGENSVSDSKSGFNIANWKSDTLDRLLVELEKTDKDQPRFPVLVDAFLRLVSANVPFLFLGDPSLRVTYVDRHICVPPNAGFSAIYYSYWDPEAKCELEPPPPDFGTEVVF